MKTHKHPNRELRFLTDAWHDGTITPEDGLRLEKHLAEDRSARAYFFEMAAIESSLTTAATRLPKSALPHPSPSDNRFLVMVAMFLMGLFTSALAFKMLAVRKTESRECASGPSAVVTGMLGVTWLGPPGDHPAPPLAGKEKYVIGSGLIELTFASGVRALIEGPAAFEVEGSNAMRLQHGKLVADVPKGAEGFTVTYPDGKIIDIGTEFGIEVYPNGVEAKVGVFRGEVQFLSRHAPEQPIHLTENHAIHARHGNATTVPFYRESFTRKLPSRDFAWNISGSRGTQEILEFDVSHLIWRHGAYRAVCKRMNGWDVMQIESAELLLEGNLVARSRHPLIAADMQTPQNNYFEFFVPAGDYRKGKWKLRFTISITRTHRSRANSSGVVLFEDDRMMNAGSRDYIGTWKHLHEGKTYHRTFHPDGSVSLTINGRRYAAIEKSFWYLSNGIFVVETDHSPDTILTEYHMLTDPKTLVFINRPYGNATKLSE